MFRQDENIDMFFSNNCIRDIIVDYSQAVKEGAIKKTKRHWIQYTRNKTGVCLAAPCARLGENAIYMNSAKTAMLSDRLGINNDKLANVSIN